MKKTNPIVNAVCNWVDAPGFTFKGSLRFFLVVAFVVIIVFSALAGLAILIATFPDTVINVLCITFAAAILIYTFIPEKPRKRITRTGCK